RGAAPRPWARRSRGAAARPRRPRQPMRRSGRLVLLSLLSHPCIQPLAVHQIAPDRELGVEFLQILVERDQLTLQLEVLRFIFRPCLLIPNLFDAAYSQTFPVPFESRF